MTQPSTPPGWYPDPSGAPGQRYFDGLQWTEHRAGPQAHTGATPLVFGAPQTASRRSKKPWILGGIGAVVVLVIAGSLSGGGKDGKDAKDNGSSSSPTSGVTAMTPSNSASVAPSTMPAPTTREAAADIGQEVRDGKFGFTVADIHFSKVAGDTSNQFMTTTAQGVYAIVTMTVQNVGAESQSYFGSNQKLIDSAGRQYSTDSAAEMWANKDIITEINPGNHVTLKAIFDVPEGTQAAALEVHDSAFSGGATIRLG